MDSCEVCRKVDSRRVFFKILFILSIIALAFAALAIVCEKTKHSCAVIHWICSLYNTFFLGFNLDGMKNVAMTVGLTGILFAWLLQVIGDKECGVELEELFRNQFRTYVCQMFIFIIAMIVCIYYSSFPSECGKGGAPAVFTSITMMCGICNMWIMCTCFLFSTKTRRMIAFRYLEWKLKKNWNERELNLWAKELDVCIGRDETEPIKAYFDNIHRETSKKKVEKNKRVELCCKSMEIAWEQSDHKQWDRFLPYLLDYQEHDAGDLMISTFMLQAGRARESNAQRFASVLDCLERGTEGKSQIPAYILALYLAFICVHENVSNETPPMNIYEQLYRIKWSEFAPPTSKGEYFEELLDTMLLCYGESYTYRPADFAARHDLKKLMLCYATLLKLYPRTAEAMSESKQKGDD